MPRPLTPGTDSRPIHHVQCSGERVLLLSTQARSTGIRPPAGPAPHAAEPPQRPLFRPCSSSPRRSPGWGRTRSDLPPAVPDESRCRDRHPADLNPRDRDTRRCPVSRPAESPRAHAPRCRTTGCLLQPIRRCSNSFCVAGPTAAPASDPVPDAGVQPGRTGRLSGSSGPRTLPASEQGPRCDLQPSQDR